MKNQAISKLDPSNVALRLGMCAAALAGTAAVVPAAHAAVVTFNTPIAIPNTFNGVYINLLTGANATTTAAVPGWDFGPWGSSNTLTFFWPTAAASNGGVGNATSYTDLPFGSVISSASTFLNSAQPTATTAFQTTGSHIVGFRFLNEGTGATNYGYATISTTGPLGFPATITSWSFENTGAPITVVPEPATGVMLSMGALALGALNLRRLRRERKLAA